MPDGIEFFIFLHVLENLKSAAACSTTVQCGTNHTGLTWIVACLLSDGLVLVQSLIILCHGGDASEQTFSGSVPGLCIVRPSCAWWGGILADPSQLVFRLCSF